MKFEGYHRLTQYKENYFIILILFYGDLVLKMDPLFSKDPHELLIIRNDFELIQLNVQNNFTN